MFNVPLPPSVLNKSLFYGKWEIPHIVDFYANSSNPANPFSGC